MARSITLTLGAGLGADLGPNFNLTTNVGSVTPSTATRTELLAGKSVSVDDLATQVTITSTGTCTNAITQIIPCATTTTTSTSTSTTTTEPPTTTTTTEAPTEANISLSNSSLDIVITDVKVNGVSVTSSSFPLYTGNGGFATTSQIGIYNVDVYYSSSVPGQNITLSGSDSTVQCYSAGGGSSILSFSSVTVNTTSPVTITISDGACF
jgi:hypothetical protein